MDKYKEDLNFDAKIREKSAKDYPYDPKLWSEASAMLDGALGAPVGKRVFKNWIYYLSAVALLGVSLWVFRGTNEEETQINNHYNISSPLVSLSPEIFTQVSLVEDQKNTSEKNRIDQVILKKTTFENLNSKSSITKERRELDLMNSVGKPSKKVKSRVSDADDGIINEIDQDKRKLLDQSSNGQDVEDELDKTNSNTPGQIKHETGTDPFVLDNKTTEKSLEYPIYSNFNLSNRNASLFSLSTLEISPPALQFSKPKISITPTKKFGLSLDFEFGHGLFGNQIIQDARFAEWANQRSTEESFKNTQYFQGKVYLSRKGFNLGLGIGNYSWKVNSSYTGEVPEIIENTTYSRRILDPNFIKDGKQVILIQEEANTTYDTSTRLEEVYVGESSIQFIQIPISLGYEKIWRNSFVVGTEIEGNIWLNPSVQGYQKLHLVHQNRPEFVTEINPVNFSMRPKLYFGYTLSRSFMIRAGIHSGFSVGSLSDVYTWKIRSTGFQTGIRWTL
jgi:hypothetical protein